MTINELRSNLEEIASRGQRGESIAYVAVEPQGEFDEGVSLHYLYLGHGRFSVEYNDASRTELYHPTVDVDGAVEYAEELVAAIA